MQEVIKIPKLYLDVINQIFEIEKKISQIQETNSLNRNISRLKDIFENEMTSSGSDSQGLLYQNPIGEKYDETRTDCEASIAGTETTDLRIIEVIKPIIRLKKGGLNSIVQKAVVIVQSQNNIQP